MNNKTQLPKKRKAVVKTRGGPAPQLLSPAPRVCVWLGTIRVLAGHPQPPVLKDLLRTGSFLGTFIRDFSWLSSPIEN